MLPVSYYLLVGEGCPIGGDRRLADRGQLSQPRHQAWRLADAEFRVKGVTRTAPRGRGKLVVHSRKTCGGKKPARRYQAATSLSASTTSSTTDSTSPLSSPSPITRITGSVPEGRTIKRPPRPSLRSALAMTERTCASSSGFPFL